MNKKKIIVVGEPPILPQLLMTPGVGHKGLLCLDDLRGSLPSLLLPEINMSRINTEINIAEIINSMPDLLLDAHVGTCCASPPELNVDDMIKTFKSLTLEINQKKLIATDAFSFQVKFPRSKKKRVRKKWAKRPENYSDMIAPRRMIDQLARCTEYVTKNILKEGFGFPGYKKFL
jgi:hypothetical protein